MINEDILNILSTSIFQKIIDNDFIKIEQLNAAINLLIKMNIPFSLTFDQATRSEEKSATLTITLNPSTSISFTINFEEGIHCY